ncbi:MAG: TetR/AcrR family transcriptional regulator, partial [Spirosomaceae bacterium]|nr:TetR/AcrR family transcriptional regulator [Spirosomataceae bacterium]
MNKVAAKAKVAKGTLYLYFQNREEIVGELTTNARKKLFEYFKKYTDEQQHPIDKIKAIFWADYFFFHKDPTTYELISFYEKNTGLLESGELAQTSKQITGLIESLLTDGKEKGFINQSVDVKATTFVLWGMANGMLQLLDTKKNDITIYTERSQEEFYGYFIDTAIEGLT